MAADGPRSFALVAEASSDARRGRVLADRAMAASPGASSVLDGSTLDHVRRWRGLMESDEFFDIHKTPKEARVRNLKSHGQFDGRKAAKDAHLVRLTLLLCKRVCPDIDALVILRDADDDPKGTRTGVEQALDNTRVPFPVVVGIPSEAMEAWLFAGYEPQLPEERALLQQVRQELGFHANERPHLLSHKAHGTRSAKRLQARFQDVMDEPFEERCLRAPLSTLRTRGGAAGLDAFLEAVETTLVPLLEP